MSKRRPTVTFLAFALLLLPLSSSAFAESPCDLGCAADRLTASGLNHMSAGNPILDEVGEFELGLEMALDVIDWIFGISNGPGSGGGIDPDFRKAASLSGRVEFELFDGDGSSTTLVNAASVELGLAIDNARLTQSSVRKHNGAVNAGDADAASRRAIEGRVYLDAFEHHMSNVVSLTQRLKSELDSQGIDLPNVSFEALLRFREDVKANGYPESEQLLAANMLITDEEMAGMLEVFASRGLPGVGPEDVNDHILGRTIEVLRQVDYRAHLPRAFAANR